MLHQKGDATANVIWPYMLQYYLYHYLIPSLSDTPPSHLATYLLKTLHQTSPSTTTTPYV